MNTKKNTKKKIIVTAIVLVILLLCGTLITFYSCTKEERLRRYAREGIKIRTGIEVPIDSKIVCHYSDSSFGPGPKEHFTVFEFEKEPTDWLKENEFLRSDGETLVDDEGVSLVKKNEGYFWSYFKTEKIDEKGIPKEYVPNFKIPYLWVDRGIHNDDFFYYPETLRLIVYLPWI